MFKTVPAVPECHVAFLQTPEFRLLALCANYIPRRWEAQKARIVAIAKSVDHDRFLQLVKRHRLPVLAAENLKRACAESGMQFASLPALEQQAGYARNMNLTLHLELLRLQLAFRQQGIEMTALKGSGLSQRLYGDAGLRQMKDIDIIVAPDDLDRTFALMNRLGYEATPVRDLRTDALIKAICREASLQHATQGFVIDLHWRFEDVPAPELESVWWQYMRESPVAPAEVELLYLCHHGARHGWGRLKWLGDVGVMFERLDTTQWHRLMQRAIALKMQEILAQTLLLLHWTLAFELSDDARALIAATQPFAGESAQSALQQLSVSNEEFQLGPSLSLFHRLRQIARTLSIAISPRSRYSWRRRMEFIAISLVMRLDDIAATPLPYYFWWAYPFIRMAKFTRVRLMHPLGQESRALLNH